MNNEGRRHLTDVERECRGTWLAAIALSQLDLTYRDKLAWSLCTVPTEPEDDGDDNDVVE